MIQLVNTSWSITTLKLHVYVKFIIIKTALNILASKYQGPVLFCQAFVLFSGTAVPLYIVLQTAAIASILATLRSLA